MTSILPAMDRTMSTRGGWQNTKALYGLEPVGHHLKRDSSATLSKCLTSWRSDDLWLAGPSSGGALQKSILLLAAGSTALREGLQIVTSDSRETFLGEKPVSFGQNVTGNLRHEDDLDKFMIALSRMDQEGKVPSVEAYRSLLKLCTKRKALAQARRVRANLAKHGLELRRSFGEPVVNMLVKCGGLEDALQVFQKLPQRTVYSWTTMISGYTKAGKAHEALRMFHQMRMQGVEPSKYTFASLLNACGSMRDLEEGKRVHTEIVKYGYESDLFVATCLVDMYAKCGSLTDAQHVFDKISHRDLVSWNVILAGYTQQGQGEKALQLYQQMQIEGVGADGRTFVSVLQACGHLAEKKDSVLSDGLLARTKALFEGRAIHAEAQKKGYESQAYVGSALVTMYGKCGSIADAQNVFNRLSRRDVVSFTAMLATYLQHGQAEVALEVFGQMHEEEVTPDARTFVTVIQACCMLAEKEEHVGGGHMVKLRSLELGKAIHVEARMLGCLSNVFVGSALVSFYGKCGSIMDAQHVFDGLLQPNVVSWNALSVAYVQHGQPEKALQLYKQMLEMCADVDDRTFVTALQACGLLADKEDDRLVDGKAIKVKALQLGKTLHAEVRRNGYGSDPFVGNALISVYGKCGSVDNAQEVFEGIPQRDVVSWNAMLAAFVQQQLPEEGLHLYSRMEGISPSNRTFVSALQFCAMLAGREHNAYADERLTKLDSLHKGKAVHAEAWVRGYESDAFVGSAVVSMYGKCGSLVDAENVFEGFSQLDIVAWNAMIAAYAQQGQGGQALHLYEQMLEEEVSPDLTTFMCVLQACGNAGALDTCVEIHHHLVSTGMNLILLVANTLISAYGKCASMVDAQHVFDALPQPDVVSWNALMAGYAEEGSSDAILQCYEKMQIAGVKPNQVTFLSLLSACSHAGMVDKGVGFFKSMSSYGITVEIEHYVTMVDLIGRAGYFNMVEDLLKRMPMQPTLTLWLCLLSACRKHGNVVLGRYAFDSAISLQPKQAAAYDIMAHIYADAGLLYQTEEVDELRREAGAWKKPGQSWIEHEQEIHFFGVGDREYHNQI